MFELGVFVALVGWLTLMLLLAAWVLGPWDDDEYIH